MLPTVRLSVDTVAQHTAIADTIQLRTNEAYMSQPTLPKRLGATLFLERPAQIDYALLMNRVGKALELDPKQAAVNKPDGSMVFAVAGDMIAGLNIDAPYPDPIDHLARFAYWWPEAERACARNFADRPSADIRAGS
jgi:hypothetical protein